MGIELNSGQLFCSLDIENWWHHSSNQVYEVSGPAGSGKTTLILYVIDRLHIELENVAFIAYMGKAVTQMMRHGLPAKTIHSFIYRYVKVPVRDENGNYVRKANGKLKMKGEFQLVDRLPENIELIVIDEGSMVSEKIATDILSFGIPTIVLGDLNQLPPVFGKPYFLQDPDYVLTEVMRQNEGNPIIWISQQILNGNKLNPGVYGSSAIITKNDLTDFHLQNSSIILTATNRVRYMINQKFREEIYAFKNLDIPHYGEKIICRKNNWNKCIGDGYYLTNGMTGFVDFVDRESYNKKSISIDFRPDFLQTPYRNLPIDYEHLYKSPSSTELEDEEETNFYDFTLNKFEWANAITVHSSQGSQWAKVLYLDERMGGNDDFYKKLQYTAVTRATDSLVLCL